jgi:hypothetical protein
MVGWPRVPACVRCRTGLVLLDILFSPCRLLTADYLLQMLISYHYADYNRAHDKKCRS